MLPTFDAASIVAAVECSKAQSLFVSKAYSGIKRIFSSQDLITKNLIIIQNQTDTDMTQESTLCSIIIKIIDLKIQL